MGLKSLKGNILTLFFPMFPFDTPRKHQKTFDFLMSSGGLKKNIGKKRVTEDLENIY